MPLLAGGLKRHDLRKMGAQLRLACHRVVSASTAVTTRLADDLARRAARLTAVAPKLRAKGEGAALELFLTRDAVAPSAFTSLNSDRAARRFCDRLVELGAIRSGSTVSEMPKDRPDTEFDRELEDLPPELRRHQAPTWPEYWGRGLQRCC